MCSSPGDDVENKSEGNRDKSAAMGVDSEAAIFYHGNYYLLNFAAKNEAPFYAKTRGLRVYSRNH